jgi:hypothetical protein
MQSISRCRTGLRRDDMAATTHIPVGAQDLKRAVSTPAFTLRPRLRKDAAIDPSQRTGPRWDDMAAAAKS